MVTGGYDGPYVTGSSSVLDSTEIFSDNVWKIAPAKLPIHLSSLKIATINNRVLSFGIIIHF